MNFKQSMLVCGISLMPLGAIAQMPVPILSESATDGRGKLIIAQADTGKPPQADTSKQLEALLLCKSGTSFTLQAAESKLQAIGLAKGTADNYFVPIPKGAKVFLFGDEVVAASVSAVAKDETWLEVYLKHQTSMQLAKKLGVSNREDDPDDPKNPSYTMQSSEKTFLSIQGAAGLVIGNVARIIKYKSSLRCQLTR